MSEDVKYNLNTWIVFTLVCICVTGADIQLIRTTTNGDIAGLVKDTVVGKKVEVFLGVPFAKPPVGDLRFEITQPAESWKGVRPALRLPPMCTQEELVPSYVNQHRPNYTATSEDCLYLNMYVPHRKRAVRKYAVLVYVHGGSNVVGSSAMFDGDILAAYSDIIVVTLAYRLGSLGFLGSVDTEMPGNYAMYDLIMGLRWVQENVGYFGGDPNMVTLMGHSSGGWNVGVLMISPLAKGLFSAVITQSGSPTCASATRRSRTVKDVQTIAWFLNCDNKTIGETKKCLKTKTAQQLCIFNPFMYDFSPYQSMYPSPLLPDEPVKMLKSGRINVKYFMTGITLSETDEWVMHYDAKDAQVGWAMKMVHLVNYHIVPRYAAKKITDTMIHEYTNWDDPCSKDELRRSLSQVLSDSWMNVPSITVAGLVADAGKEVYFYQFAHRSAMNNVKESWMGVPHGFDIFYFFGVPLQGHANRRYDELDKNASKLMMEYWSNFIKYRNLTPKNRQNLLVFDTKNQTYFKISSSQGVPEITLHHRYRNKAKHFWNHYVPRLITHIHNVGVHIELIFTPFIYVLQVFFVWISI